MGIGEKGKGILLVVTCYGQLCIKYTPPRDLSSLLTLFLINIL